MRGGVGLLNFMNAFADSAKDEESVAVQQKQHVRIEQYRVEDLEAKVANAKMDWADTVEYALEATEHWPCELAGTKAHRLRRLQNLLRL